MTPLTLALSKKPMRVWRVPPESSWLKPASFLQPTARANSPPAALTDQPPGKRIHMVSLGGAVEASPHMPSLDYDGFLRTTLSMTRDMRDVEQAFRRMIFNLRAHNRDVHVRQHAYLIDGKGECHLSPAFDLTFSPGPGVEYYMAIECEGRDITHADVVSSGVRHGISRKRIGTIVDEVRAAVADWVNCASLCGVTVSLTGIKSRLAATDQIFVAGR